jgi:hypothetical protein
MALNITIPAASLAVGAHTFGPGAIPAGLSHAMLTLDTTPYDALPGPTLDFKAELSQDSGVSFPITLATAKYVPPNGSLHGVQQHTTSFVVDLPGVSPAGNTWRIRATIIVSNQSYDPVNTGSLAVT